MYTRVLVSRFGRPKSKVSEDLGKPSRPANRSNEDRRPAAVKACPGVFRKRDPKTATFSRDPGPVPSRTRRLLSDPLARTSYGWQHGTWSSSPDGQAARQGAMKTGTASAQWTPAYNERLEKTQTYNLSLEASTHDLLAAVTSTRRGPCNRPQDDRGRKRVKVKLKVGPKECGKMTVSD